MAYYFPAWTAEWYFVSCGYGKGSHKSVLQSGGLQKRSWKWCRKLPMVFRWSNTCIPAHLSALDSVMGATCRWEVSEGTKVYNAVERKKWLPESSCFLGKRRKRNQVTPWLVLTEWTLQLPSTLQSGCWKRAACSLPYNCSWVLFELHSSLKMKKKNYQKKKRGGWVVLGFSWTMGRSGHNDPWSHKVMARKSFPTLEGTALWSLPAGLSVQPTACWPSALAALLVALPSEVTGPGPRPGLWPWGPFDSSPDLLSRGGAGRGLEQRILKSWANTLILNIATNEMGRTSLVAQWIRICLPMQQTRVRSLV